MKSTTEAKKYHTSGADACDHRLERQIRRRAYELFRERGMVDGHHVEDWLQAEREIKGGGTLQTPDKAAA